MEKKTDKKAKRGRPSANTKKRSLNASMMIKKDTRRSSSTKNFAF